MKSKVLVGDYFANNVNDKKEATVNNVVTSVSTYTKDAGNNQLVTITTAVGTFTVSEWAISMTGTNIQGVNCWVIQQ